MVRKKQTTTLEQEKATEQRERAQEKARETNADPRPARSPLWNSIKTLNWTP